jgi:hypothetical protein
VDPLDQSRWLTATTNCNATDPSTTPAPLPTLAAGDWLNGWELSCQRPLASGEIVGVRGEFLVGAVKGCRVERATDADASTDRIESSNPGGDRTVLRIGWTAQACSSDATVSILPTLSGYHVHVIAIPANCGSTRFRTYAVTFVLGDPIDASLIEGEKSEPGGGRLPEGTLGP